jgi:hypothetical protein
MAIPYTLTGEVPVKRLDWFATAEEPIAVIYCSQETVRWLADRLPRFDGARLELEKVLQAVQQVSASAAQEQK